MRGSGELPARHWHSPRARPAAPASAKLIFLLLPAAPPLLLPPALLSQLLAARVERRKCLSSLQSASKPLGFLARGGSNGRGKGKLPSGKESDLFQIYIQHRSLSVPLERLLVRGFYGSAGICGAAWDAGKCLFCFPACLFHFAELSLPTSGSLIRGRSSLS